MYRKLNKVGSNTFTVSLPATWIRHNNLSSDSYLNLIENKRQLVLSIDTGGEPRTVTIDLNNSKEYTKKYLIQAYKKGYDEIKVLYSSPETLTDLTEVLGVLVGFEIIEQRQSYVILKNITKHIDTNVDSLIKKTILITTDISSSLYTATINKDINQMKQVISSEQINNRLCLLVERIISKEGYAKDYHAIPFVITMMYKLENLADYYKLLAGELIKNQKLLNNAQILHFMKSVYEAQNIFKELTDKENLLLNERIQCLKNEFSEAITVHTPATSETGFCLGILFTLFQEIYDLCGIYTVIVL